MQRKWFSLVFSIVLAAVAILAVVAQPVAADSTTVVISEFRTRGTGSIGPGGDLIPEPENDQFIELYNLSAGSVVLDNYCIYGWDDVTSMAWPIAQIPTGVTLLPYEHYLVVNGGNEPGAGYSGTADPDENFIFPMFSNGVGLALLAPNVNGDCDDTVGIVIDSVSTTASAPAMYREGTVLDPMASDIDQSYERLPGIPGIAPNNGHINTEDSDDNSADFIYNNGSSNPESQAASSPTAITLQDFSAQAQPAAAWLWPLALVVVLGGALIVSRRRA